MKKDKIKRYIDNINGKHFFRSLKIDGAGGTASTSKNVALIKINKKSFMTDIKNFPVAEGYVLIAFNSVLRHETIHLLDFLLSIKPNDKKPLFKVTVTNRKKKQKKIERGGMSSISTAELENLMSYINNPYEFNVAVRLIKKQKTGTLFFGINF